MIYITISIIWSTKLQLAYLICRYVLLYIKGGVRSLVTKTKENGGRRQFNLSYVCMPDIISGALL